MGADPDEVAYGKLAASLKGPDMVAIPLGKAIRWARWASGAAILAILAQWAFYGDEYAMRWRPQGTVDPLLFYPESDALDLSSRRHDGLRWLDRHGRALSNVSNSSSNSSSNVSSALAGAHQASSASHGSSSSQGSSHGKCGGHSPRGQSINSTLCFLFTCFLVCTVVDHCNLFVPFEWRFPISVMLFLIGGVFGLFFNHVTHTESDHFGNGFNNVILGMQGAAHFDPHSLLYVVLPPLLYESAGSMDWHVLRKLLPSSVLLAIPGVMLNTLLTGCFAMSFVRIGGNAPMWSESWLLGSILSATDPVAVVSALAALGAPKKLSTLVEGESLLNDGSAVVCAYVFLDWSSAPNDHKYCSGDPPSPGCVFGYFCRVALGGTAIGLGIGVIMYFWIKLARARRQPMLELAIVFISVYTTFYVAEAAITSGVLATVALGFLMSAGTSKRMSHEGRHNHHVILAQVAYFCNQVAFFAGGIVSARFMYDSEGRCDHTAMSGRAWAELFGLYIVIHITRGAVVLCFWPFLRRMGYGINWKEACIMVYGGLRGAVGLIMGLIVEHNHYIDPATAQMVAFHTSGIVLLTLFINGSTIDGLYKRLRLYPSNFYRMTHLRRVLFKLEAECQKGGIKELCEDWFFHDCHFKKILRCTPSFSNIGFDAAGVPYPDNIEPVKTTLQSLSEEAAQFRESKEQVQRQKSTFEDPFSEKWARRKVEIEKSLVELMTASSEMTEQKDSMIHVVNTGDKLLQFSPPEQRASAGFYVSAKTFQSILKSTRSLVPPMGTTFQTVRDDEEMIEFKFVKVDNATVIIGLLIDEEDLLAVRPVETQVLGIQCENSVGFNCNTCTLHVNRPGGYDQVATGRHPLQPGDEVSIRLTKQKGLEPEVVITVQSSSAPATIVSCPFGFTAEDVHPVVEFRHTDEKRMVTDAPPNNTTMWSHDVPHVSTAGAVGAAITQGGKSIIEATMNIVKGPSEVADDLSQALHKRGTSGAKGGHTCGAKVCLSFEPQLASDAEGLNELFHVLFNSVMHHYTLMHEHGILGDVALSWLSEANGAGLDSANHEVNSMHLSDFKMNSKDGNLDSDSDNKLGKSEADTQEGVSRRSKQRHSTAIPEFLQETRGSIHTPATITKMKSVFEAMKESTSSTQTKIMGLFEPLIVEYLSLESMIAATSFWDRFPMTWERSRLMGYSDTRAKTECLWAFVEAHEKVLANSVSITRFPDMVRCIRTLVKQAKDDLKILGEVHPRRLYYCKHTLALRVLMTRRMKKLEKCVHGGGIAPGDAVELSGALWERIMQSNQFKPRISRSVFSSASPRASPVAMGRAISTGSGGGERIVNAWDDLVLPSIVPDGAKMFSVPPSPSAGRSPSAAQRSQQRELSQSSDGGIMGGLQLPGAATDDRVRSITDATAELTQVTSETKVSALPRPPEESAPELTLPGANVDAMSS